MFISKYITLINPFDTLKFHFLILKKKFDAIASKKNHIKIKIRVKNTI